METKMIEATQNGGLLDQFLIGRFDDEWWRRGLVNGLGQSLLRQEGWGPEHLLVLSLTTPGTGAIFAVRSDAWPEADLKKRRLMNAVSPLMVPFLEWLYVQDLKDLQALPDVVELEGVFERADRLRKEQEPPEDLLANARAAINGEI